VAYKIQTLDGLPVYDATESISVHVTRADIHAKDRRNPEKCAMAEACKRDLHVVEARAYLSRLYIRYADSDRWLRYKLPETVRQEVAAFDRGGGFSEGVYHIPALSPNTRAGGKYQGGRGKHGTDNPPQKRQTHRNVADLRVHSPLSGGAIEPTPHRRREDKI
jgi:hypothetical protein